MKRQGARDLLIALALGAVAALAMFQYWGAPTHFLDPDALFYQAQTEEVRGTPRVEALRRVFASDLATQLRRAERDLPRRLRTADNREWVEYSARFYRRRWTVPAAAAALTPALGDEALETVALLGYVAGTMLLYLLLRRRFRPLVSGAVTVASLGLPPLRLIASLGLTDSWGLALLIAGLLCASLALEHGRRWLLPWIAVTLLLSFTRDFTIVLVAAAAWTAISQRTRIAAALAVSGLLASVPAPLIAGAPLRENLAYVIEGYHIPADTSWGFIASHYPGQLLDVIGEDLTYPLEFAFPASIPMFAELLVIVLGAVALIAMRRRGDPFFGLMRGALAGGALTILISINYTGWRLELAMLPAVAVGVAMLAEYLLGRLPGPLGSSEGHVRPVT